MNDYKDTIIDLILKYTSRPYTNSWFGYDKERGWMYCHNVAYTVGPQLSDIIPVCDFYVDAYYFDAYQWDGTFRLTITPDGENHREFFKKILSIDNVDIE